MGKLYFSNSIHEGMFCHTKNDILEEMWDRGLNELIVYEAIRELHTPYFFCKHYNEIGLTIEGEIGCGKECEGYKPRNGKSGCCQHRGFCYVRGNKFKLLIDGKRSSI